ncbi:Ribonuclease T2 precursor (RNase T2) [Neophaeococcomyces mojaviensis]|uniref:Ribonuclease T2 (RNase T2) n=1 Tax=Neophaeococcomyces mojaviensis TaxID=3383035 RepID=A0ACC3ACD5_9EURO|nr:Ribonuclease T2 precursor (RNase T2) [Knufia sp. JES_112]
MDTQFWDTSPALGANDTWTLHGLWPDYCKGGFDAYCDETRNLSPHEIARIVARASEQDATGTHPGMMDFMNDHWLSYDSQNAHLWAHEWNKHGTCISTLAPSCYERDSRLRSENSSYVAETSGANISKLSNDADILDYFTHAILLFTTRPTFEFFAAHDIVPSYDRTYTLDQLQSAINDSPHGFEATIKCRNHNELSEIWYHFNVRGSLRSAMEMWGNKLWDSWVPTHHDGQRSNCPSAGIKYLPKEQTKPPGTTTTITRTQTHTATATATQTKSPNKMPFTGKGRLMIKIVSEENPASSNELSQEDTTKTEYNNALGTQPIPQEYTGCLIRKGTWYMARSMTSCATFTAHDDVTSILESDTGMKYHLFTLESHLAPCSFVPEKNEEDEPKTASENLFGIQQSDSAVPLRPSYFACDRDMPFQSILSNNASVDQQHVEFAKRLAVGSKHQSTFYAKQIPEAWKQERLYTDNNGGEREVQIEIYWETF